jgi:hypothetical protein
MKWQSSQLGLMLTLLVTLSACGGATTTPEEPIAIEPDVETPEAQTAGTGTETETGTLVVRANGEDFVRQGFVSKDGWTIAFDQLDVNFGPVTAYQSDPAFDAQGKEAIAAQTEVTVTPTATVDLAAGDETAEPIVVGEAKAAPGHYNALAWTLVAAETPAMRLVGTATKDGQTVAFQIDLDRSLGFECGDYVGDERKGILQAGQTTDLEATFHFDHLFGDGTAAADDEINTGALGFDPLAAIATDGQIETSISQLKTQLDSADVERLNEIVPNLAHVGEGHCRAVEPMPEV